MLTVLHLQIHSMRTYGFSDANLDDCSGAEGRLASISSLYHQGPGVVSFFGNVLNDGHWLDIGLELDLSRVRVNVKDVVVRLSVHDGILNNIVWYFCVIVYGLKRDILDTHTKERGHIIKTEIWINCLSLKIQCFYLYFHWCSDHHCLL